MISSFELLSTSSLNYVFFLTLLFLLMSITNSPNIPDSALNFQWPETGRRPFLLSTVPLHHLSHPDLLTSIGPASITKVSDFCFTHLTWSIATPLQGFLALIPMCGLPICLVHLCQVDFPTITPMRLLPSFKTFMASNCPRES